MSVAYLAKRHYLSGGECAKATLDLRVYRCFGRGWAAGAWLRTEEEGGDHAESNGAEGGKG